MFLIIPVIEISNGQVVRQVVGAAGISYPSDPAALARVWRRENAKVLHVTDTDSLTSGVISNIDAIRNVVRSVDVPIEVSGDIRTYEQCGELLDAGVYRVILNVALADHGEIARIVRDFLPQRIVAGFTASEDVVVDLAGKPTGVKPVELGHAVKAAGVLRAVFRTRETRSGEMLLDLDGLKELATETGLRVTCGGGIRNVQDLWAVQALEQFGVDSTIMSKPLYQNKFPCQELWRRVEANELRVS